MAANYGLSGTFDGSEFHLTIGPLIITGFSDGDAVTVTRSQNLAAYRNGLDGATGRAIILDKSGTVELRLLQTSSANDDLSALLNLDSLFLEGRAAYPISVTDFSGRTVLAASQCWLETLPPVAFSTAAVGERVWTFRAADLEMYIGGNN